jgi:lipopolysaccharide export system protein LptC
MDVRNTLQLIALLIAAVASGVLLLRNTQEPQDVPATARLGIGYYMTDVELIVTGDDGRVLYRVRTDKATQNVEAGTIALVQVRVDYDPNASIPWDLSAEKGHITADRNIIRLEGDVVAQTKDEDDTPITIRTDFLELDTETYIADTESKVAIDYATNRVFATGMRAYFREDRLLLLSDVNGHFDP